MTEKNTNIKAIIYWAIIFRIEENNISQKMKQIPQLI